MKGSSLPRGRISGRLRPRGRSGSALRDVNILLWILAAACLVAAAVVWSNLLADLPPGG